MPEDAATCAGGLRGGAGQMRAACMFRVRVRAWVLGVGWGNSSRIKSVLCQVVHDGSRVGNESIDLVHQFCPTTGQGYYSPFQVRPALRPRPQPRASFTAGHARQCWQAYSARVQHTRARCLLDTVGHRILEAARTSAIQYL